MAERIRKDFQGILTKYAEAFVLNDELKKAFFREELEKFRETNGLQLKNIGLKEKIDQLTREIGAGEEKNKQSKAKFDGEILGLERTLEGERKDSLLVLNQMIKSMEAEKETRFAMYSIMDQTSSPGGEKSGEVFEEVDQGERVFTKKINHNKDDAEFYKARLIEESLLEQKEVQMRTNSVYFTKKIVFTDDGVDFYGTPKSSQVIHRSHR